MQQKINIDQVINWLTIQGEKLKELGDLIKTFYKFKRNRFIPEYNILMIFEVYMMYGAETFSIMQNDITSNKI
jgi:hypothetical protein